MEPNTTSGKVRFFNGTTVAAAVSLFGVVAVTVLYTQFYTTSEKLSQAREAAIMEWAQANPSESEGIAHNRKECQEGLNRRHVKQLTFSEYTAPIGDQSLSKALENADDSVKIPAPLRWLLSESITPAFRTERVKKGEVGQGTWWPTRFVCDRS